MTNKTAATDIKRSPGLDTLIARVRALPQSLERDTALEHAEFWIAGTWVARSCGQRWESPFIELLDVLEKNGGVQ